MLKYYENWKWNRKDFTTNLLKSIPLTDWISDLISFLPLDASVVA